MPYNYSAGKKVQVLSRHDMSPDEHSLSPEMARKFNRHGALMEGLNKLPASLLCGIGVVLVLIVGIIDILTGYGFIIGLLYFIPIILSGWHLGTTSVVLMSLVCALTWSAVDITSANIYSQNVVRFWNFLAVLGMFLISGCSVSYMKSLIVRQRKRRQLPVDEQSGRDRPVSEKEKSVTNWPDGR